MINDKNFLQYNGVPTGRTRILLFATSGRPKHLADISALAERWFFSTFLLRQSPTMPCDGTLKTVPWQFSNFTPLMVKRKLATPLPFAYALMSSKSEEAYIHLFAVSSSFTLLILDMHSCSTPVLLLLCILIHAGTHKRGQPPRIIQLYTR